MSEKFLFVKCNSAYQNMRSVIFIFQLIPLNTIFWYESRLYGVHIINLPTSQLLLKGKGVENGGDSKDIKTVKCKVQKAMYSNLRCYLQPSIKTQLVLKKCGKLIHDLINDLIKY